MSQPNASLPYFNSYGVKSGDVITPNLGVSQVLEDNDGYIREELTMATADMANPILASTDATANPKVSLGKIPLVPGTLKVTMSFPDGVGGVTTQVITDNGAGELLASPGVLTTGTIDYGHNDNEPAIEFTAPNSTDGTNPTTVIVEVVQDQPKEFAEVIKGELGYFTCTTNPIIVPYNLSQVQALSAKRALQLDMRKMTLD